MTLEVGWSSKDILLAGTTPWILAWIRAFLGGPTNVIKLGRQGGVGGRTLGSLDKHEPVSEG